MSDSTDTSAAADESEPPVVEEESPDVEELPDVEESTEAEDPTELEEVVVIETDDPVVPGVEEEAAPAVRLAGVRKAFGEFQALADITLDVPAGSFYGLVGPNGAGKTTTLSIIAGLLAADDGDVVVAGVDAHERPLAAKRALGVLPDRLRIFDRLTGRQLLYYYGALRGLPAAEVESRAADLARAFDLTESLGRVVSDYSAGMTKKIMLAGALIHSPRVLVLDEPFEAVDPVSSAAILDILSAYVEHGGTVILSSHGMELVERVCSRVAVIVGGELVAEGAVADVRGEGTLEERYRELVGAASTREGLEWLHMFSD
ncbi:ABC transporter ATP-binding protein [Microbacterium sediminicola]|uniref:ABC transporter ATP-binding protein n=1 Tax=Microbacterium sediminicola TaxID=415210 RepID=A0ABP4TMB4_9MICO